ncbi:MAG: aldehyde dehydrogenase family protein [Acidobacteria bacterium]|nr:aldehyde dehydrogenase family protein [Acidobacteriota bacterium]
MAAQAATTTRLLTAEEKHTASDLLVRARAAMKVIEHYDQATVDRLCQAIAWATANEATSLRLANMSVDESGMGSREPARRLKVLGVLRDALRQKSMGVIEEIPDKQIVKYAKPAGVIASLIPVTNPVVTPATVAIYAVKCKDAVIFSPHPASKKTTTETVRIMRAALKKQGAPEDILLCAEKPSIPLAQELMSICDLTIATGGPAMVRAAYSSGRPAFGVGAGNATVVIDETADIADAAKLVRMSKINDNGSGCSADGNLVVDTSIYDAFLTQLQKEGGYLVNDEEKKLLQAVYWDSNLRRTPETIARPATVVAQRVGIKLPPEKTFFIVKESNIGKEYPFSTEKLGVVLSIFEYSGGFENAIEMVKKIFDTGGKGHSCGIYSFDDEHIHKLALAAPVSRMMVRQAQSKANAGNFTNGMPMTSSMGCGTWGGNIVSENISLKHYMNVTWVSRPLPEDKPSEQELLGEFYNSEIF